MQRRPAALMTGIAVSGILIGSLTLASQQGQPSRQPNQIPGDESVEPFTPQQMMGALGQQLVAGLEATPGCFGAEAAAFASGKLAIFGWFEDKDAALAWHSSNTHRGVSQRFAGGRVMNNIPLEHVEDGVPLMVIASIVMEPQDNGAPRMTFGIEVYEPMPGGFSFQGGAFSPDGFQKLMAKIREDAGS
ncbi:MAG: hypothetical protein AAGJ54_06875 [Planctomycetota bacterium]